MIFGISVEIHSAPGRYMGRLTVFSHNLWCLYTYPFYIFLGNLLFMPLKKGAKGYGMHFYT